MATAVAGAQGSASSGGSARSVWELLQERADPQAARLLQALDTLSARNSLARSGRTAAAAASARSSGSGATSAPPAGTSGARGGWAGAAALPDAGSGAPLPPFAWAPCSEHVALQAAAAAAGAAAYGAGTVAYAAWMSWAMQPANIGRVLDLAWWAVAALFQPHHPRSEAVAARVVESLARHYVSTLMAKRGARGDAYLRLWAAATAAAAGALLRAAFPASAAGGKLGPALEARLARQLRLWCTGAGGWG